MVDLIIKKYEDIYNRHTELSGFNKMIPENKQFIREGDIIKYIRFDDKDEIIKTAFIIKKFNNKLLLKSFSYNDKSIVWYIWLKNNFIFFKSKSDKKNFILKNV
jgi:parvulin-like peptidyl-prolyl isomerase